ncbi:MAG TPA: diguanylate cyclase [Thermoanaerobaculaceae bacterium]|nr:diguanylate cyclase [Thermoanaerobaculaceae bacterium]
MATDRSVTRAQGRSGRGRRALAVAAAVVTAAAAAAQQPALRVYGIQDGLKFPQVFTVMQDSRGLLWVGTSYGIGRYDGREFTSLTKSSGLPHDSVRGLAEDGDGTIWALTKQGVALVSALGGPLGAPKVLQLPPALAPLKQHPPKAAVARGDSVWLVGDAGVARFRGGRLEAVLLPPEVAGEEPGSLAPADGGGVWVGTKQHVVWLGDGGPPRVVGCPAELGTVVGVVRLGDRTLVVQSAGIARLSGDRCEPEAGWGLPADAAPTEAIALGDRLVVVTPSRGALLLRRGQPLTEISVKEGLPSEAVYGAASDREGLLWLATANGLVKVFDLALRSYPSRSPALGAMVLAFAEDARDGLWVGHSEGATLIRGGTMELHDTRQLRSEEAGVWALLALPGGGVLAGTRQGVALIRNGRVRHLPELPTADKARIFSLARDAGGWVWAGTAAGAVRFRWDDVRGRATDARVLDRVGDAPLGEVRGISPAADGAVWIGTDGGGVALWDGSAMRVCGRDAGLPSPVCRAVLARPGGAWVGTDVGLWSLAAGRATEVASVNRALSDRYVVGMAADADGSVWLATPYEVVKIVNDEVVARIDQALGLVGASTSAENCVAVRPGGSVLVGTVGGFTEVPQDWDLRRRPEPIVLLLGVEDRAGRPVAAEATVPYRFNALTFAFASPSFLAEQHTLFQERLVGYDTGWSAPHAYPSQRYTNLPEGDYLFEVRAVGRGGVVSRVPARFPFAVAPAWWQTMPARAGFGLGVVGLAYGIALLRTRRIRRRNEELEATVRERTHQLAEANQALERLATTDGLTGIANHRVFQAKLGREWARAGRDGTSLSLLMIDIDAFKAYNDALGHQAGDSCLRRVAQAVASHAARAGDLAARYGGEEFAVLLTGTDAEGARVVAEKVRAAVERLAVPHPASPVAAWVTVSVGVATMVPAVDGEPAVLVAAADRGLYAAKHAGRNAVRVGG